MRYGDSDCDDFFNNVEGDHLSRYEYSIFQDHMARHYMLDYDIYNDVVDKLDSDNFSCFILKGNDNYVC